MANQLHENTVRQAHYQIEAMCHSMLKAAQSQDPDTHEKLPFLVQSLAIRISTINDALTSVINGEDRANEDLHFEVIGSCAEVHHV